MAGRVSVCMLTNFSRRNDCVCYIARGIYEQACTENNHTFNVVMHTYDAQCQLSIVENVQPTVICPPEINTDVLRQGLWLIENTTKGDNTENCATGACASKLNVMDQKSARKRYRYILWMDEYMVFEVGRTGRGRCMLQHGASVYYEYDDVPYIISNDEHVPRLLRRLKCASMSNSSDCQTRPCGVVVGSGKCACVSSKALLLIKPAVYYKHFNDLVRDANGIRDSKLAHDISPNVLHDLCVYEDFHAEVVDPFMKAAYAENMTNFNMQCSTFYKLHPHLVGVPGTEQHVNWQSALHENHPLPHSLDVSTTDFGGIPISGRGCLLEGGWSDAVVGLSPFTHGSSRLMGGYVFAHTVPNANIQQQMSVLLIHTNELIRAYQSMRSAQHLGRRGSGGVRDRLRVLLGLIDECLCGKFLTEFRNNVNPIVLDEMRAAIDMPLPKEHVHQSIVYFLYRSLAFLLHYTNNGTNPPNTTKLTNHASRYSGCGGR